MSDSPLGPKLGGGWKLGSFVSLLLPAIVIAGFIIGAERLWTNRAIFCRQFPTAPYICTAGTIHPSPTPTFTPTYSWPPGVCGGYCDPGRGQNCGDGLDCVQQHIYGGICLGDSCNMGCWKLCRTDAECASGLTCEHDPAAPAALGYCVGSTCPENRACISGDGVCDPTCEAGRLANQPTRWPVCGWSFNADGTRVDTCCAYGPDAFSCFISRDSDCPFPTPTLPPSSGGGSEPVSTQAACAANPGDGVCCAAAGETAETDPACGSGQPADAVICGSDDQNGIKWQGTTCTCEGVEVYTYVCNNDQPIYQPTGGSCTPPANCPAPGGDGGSNPGGSDGGSGCVPSAPACDFIDNDCDGQIDEYPDDCDFG